jgi:hypothetical protein
VSGLHDDELLTLGNCEDMLILCDLAWMKSYLLYVYRGTSA